MKIRVPQVAVCILSLALLAGACGGSNNNTPPTTPAPTTGSLQAPALTSPTGGQQLQTLRPTLSVTNSVTTGTVGTVTYDFDVSEVDTFPTGSRTTSARGIAQGSGGSTTWSPHGDLAPNTV